MDKTPSISNNHFKDRLEEIKKYYEPIDEDDLYICENKYGIFINFLSFDDPITLFYNITNGHKTLKDAKDLQKAFKKRIKDLKDYDISNGEKYKIDQIKNLYNLRNHVIFDDYNLMQKGEGLKILTPNQMFKRLPIALAQVKAGNNSESLLNEIGQIVYSLYRSKENTKKVYNNIINSIKP